ncbi:CCN family member 4 isoform X1 [Microcaecilia unicolor]|uniref:CCN family member 3 n=1 Tax=Microcaecilia unicolor TaxID=1415580 RepID=A0A6P7X792_9AMPH|nr:WNT1-inducible-signaling pathway protein 1 isoform X1 [Microcaecilia unicolor]
MRWLQPCILAASVLLQVTAQNFTMMPPTTDTAESYNRTQYCKWPCECPDSSPRCPMGISLIVDGCNCCKTCAKQLGENCTEADTCDPHKGLYCDYSRDRPRYEIGVCAPLIGMGCVLNDIRYRNGESFQPNCKYNCTCINGAVGCIPMCINSQPPLVWCQNPKRIKIPGKCCKQWICDDSRKIRKTSPRHVSSSGENESWHKNCIGQTTPWSPCSKTCGMGISTRISNDNEQCRLGKERRLCNMRPCEVDITKHIKPGKQCLAVYRSELPTNFTLSGCVSKALYRPKYCGLCLDDRCCTPYKSKTIEVSFQCPDGSNFSRSVMWINACFCNLSCRKNPNDFFQELTHYHDYLEIAN